MVRKSDGEKIDELEKIVATLVERLDNVRPQVDAVKDLKTRLGNFSITLERGAADRSLWFYVMRYGEWNPRTAGHSRGATHAVGRGVARRNPCPARSDSRTGR